MVKAYYTQEKWKLVERKQWVGEGKAIIKPVLSITYVIKDLAMT